MSSHLPPRRARSETAIRLLAVAALVISVAVLILDISAAFLDSTGHRVLSSAPLIAIAVAYLGLQIIVRPSPRQLLERTLLALAFLLWAASQLFAPSRLAAMANDGAILLFVFDVGLIIRDEIRARPETRNGQDEAPAKVETGSTCVCCRDAA